MTAQAVSKYFNPVGYAGKIPALDGLRAIAIILVLIRHAATGLRDNFFPADAIDGPLWNMALNGWIGVDLFFVLSGFLVGYHIIRSWPSKYYMDFIKRYWLKRLLRTFPLYYAIIIIILLDVVPFYKPHSVDTEYSLRIHILFMQDYIGADLLVPLWSLATEEKFYFLSPFLIWIVFYLQKTSHLLVILAIALLVFLSIFIRSVQLDDALILNYSNFFWAYRAPFHFAFQGLLMGLLVAYLYSHNLQPNSHSVSIFRISLLVLITILIADEWMSDNANWNITSMVLFVININFAVMIFACGNSEKLNQGWLSTPVLRFFSRMSYSLYLVHYLFIPWSTHIAKSITNTHWLSIVFFLLCYISLSLVTAYLLHLIVEKPFLLLKDKISIANTRSK